MSCLNFLSKINFIFSSLVIHKFSWFASIIQFGINATAVDFSWPLVIFFVVITALANGNVVSLAHGPVKFMWRFQLRFQLYALSGVVIVFDTDFDRINAGEKWKKMMLLSILRHYKVNYILPDEWFFAGYVNDADFTV